MRKSALYIFIGLFLMIPYNVCAVEYDAGVQGKVILQTETTSGGDPITYLKTDKPKITVMTVEIAPAARTGWHSHPMPVYAYVISGKLSVEIEGGKTVEFKEGEAIIEVVNKPHNGINNGAVPVKLVVFYVGGKEIPNVIKSDKP